MTEPAQPFDVIDDVVSDVMVESDVVHVQPAVADLVESMEHHGETFVADVPDWEVLSDTRCPRE